MSVAALAAALPADGVILRATFLVAFAWVVSAALRQVGASAAMRHLVWLLGFVGLLLFPLLMAAMPVIPLPILPQAAAPAAVAFPAPVGHGWAAVPWAIHLAVAGALTMRFVAGRLLLALRWRAAEPADEGWTRSLDSVRREVGLRRAVRLRLATGPVMPMTWGTLAPRLLLPREAADWPEDRRRLVLLHELAHVRRGDSLGQSLAALACALYWFHPAVWLAARRLRLEQEHAADDLVLAAGASAPLYARGLLALAAGLGAGATPAGAAAMSNASQLERRLAAIVGGGSRARPTSAAAAACVALALGITWIVALAVPVAATTPPAPAPAPAADTAWPSRAGPAPADVADPRDLMSAPAPAVPVARRRATISPAGARSPAPRRSAEAKPAVSPIAATAAVPALPATPPVPVLPRAPDPVPAAPLLPVSPVAPNPPAPTSPPPAPPTAPSPVR